MLALPIMLSALVMGSAVTVTIIAVYYLRPAYVEHNNSRSAAVAVVSPQAEHERVESGKVAPYTSHGLLCGYDTSTAAMIENLPEDFSLVRPYLDDPDYRRAALMTLTSNASTRRLSPVFAAA